MPGQPANKNSATHGLLCARGGLPRGSQYIGRLVGRFSRRLTADVLALHGHAELSAAEQEAVSLATSWEQHRLLALRWLRVAKDLPPVEALQFSREASRAAMERHKAVASLGLRPRGPADEWDSLYAEPAESEAVE